MKKLQSNFPEFIAGFDLVGQEDKGRPLIEFAEKLLKFPEDVNFFLHAGETNWLGCSSDENLVRKNKIFNDKFQLNLHFLVLDRRCLARQ